MKANNAEIGTLLTGISYGGRFDIDENFVFIADGETIKRVSINGGKMDVILSKEPYRAINNIATDGAYVYWLSQQQLQRMQITVRTIETVADGLVCDNAGHSNDSMFYGRYLYCVNVGSYGSANTISRISIDTGSISQIAANVGYISDWTTDGTNVFYSNQDSGKVNKVSVIGGAVETMFTTNGFDITVLASDGQYLYWFNQTNVAKTKILGGNTEYIYSGLTGGASTMMVDENNIYWSLNTLNGGVINLGTPK